MCFKHIHTLHVSVICNKITYDLSLLQVQFSSRSGRHKSWNFSQFLTKNCSTVNSRGNLILKMVLASNLLQYEIGVCQQSIKILKLVSNSHQYQFWNWCLPAININFEIGVCQLLHIFTLDYIYDICVSNTFTHYMYL